jgi:hypothetical protein
MRWLVFLLVIGCSSATHPIRIVNVTPRAIAAVYVYPVGAKEPGKSKGALAPNATLDVRMPEGNVEVRAVAVEETLENGQRENKEATQVLELKAATEVVFTDSTQQVVEQPGKVYATFRVIP